MKLTYYTIIGKDLNLFQGHVQNVKTYAGLNEVPDFEFLTIVYTNSTIPHQVTDSILQYCQEENIRTVLYHEPTTSFIENLYACWNLGYKEATGHYIFRAGSDQVFSKNSFPSLYAAAERLHQEGKNKIILQANTIENLEKIAAIGANSRHICRAFGNNFLEFQYERFEKFVERLNKEAPELINIDTALRLWGHPRSMYSTLGLINRTDGCSWLMTKKDYEEYGPLPVFEKNYTGDVVIHDRLQLNGYQDFIVRDCVTYHFVRGESSENY